MNRYQIALEVWTQYCHQNFGAVEYEFGHRVGFSEYLDRKLDQQQAELPPCKESRLDCMCNDTHYDEPEQQAEEEE